MKAKRTERAGKEVDLDRLFARLANSSFRSRFRLREAEARYLRRKGLPAVLDHGHAFLLQRLAPADLPGDGKQTPYRGHPFFVAQHATGTCCRGCLEKWHGISRGKPLGEDDVRYILDVAERWLSAELASAIQRDHGEAPPPDLWSDTPP